MDLTLSAGQTCVLVVPGEVERLEVVSQLFAALLLLLSALFTLLPVGSSRDVQQRLAGQNLPAHTHKNQVHVILEDATLTLAP